MAGEHLWDSAKEIVVKMRDIIQSNTEDRVKESRFGWQYRLLSESKDMKGDMEAQGYQVRFVPSLPSSVQFLKDYHLGL